MSPIRVGSACVLAIAIAIVDLLIFPVRPARAGNVTYDFSIFILTEDERGAGGLAEGPWVGQTLTGFATYDDSSWTELEAGFGIEFEVTDFELHLPSGTVLTEEDNNGFPFTFVLPAEPYYGFTGFLDGSSETAPDPLDPSIYALQFTVNNTDGAGFRYFDENNCCAPAPFVNGYYGQVTYTLRVEEALETLIEGASEIPPNDPKSPQMTSSNDKVNEKRLNAVLNKLNAILELLQAGEVETAVSELESLRMKLDCDPTPRDWFVCGSDAQTYLIFTIDQLLAATAGAG